MLSPMMISMPFKLMFFVLADGWTLIMQSLIELLNLMNISDVIDIGQDALLTVALFTADPWCNSSARVAYWDIAGGDFYPRDDFKLCSKASWPNTSAVLYW